MESHSRAALLPGWLWNGAADRNLLPNGKPIFTFFFSLCLFIYLRFAAAGPAAVEETGSCFVLSLLL